MRDFPRDETAIVGVGATEFSRNSGRTELVMAAEAVKAALDDAGLAPADVDGMVKFVFDTVAEVEVARCLGIPELRWFGEIGYGGGASCGTVAQAVAAVAAGLAGCVVCFRSMNEASGRRYGLATASLGVATTDDVHWSWYWPFGLINPVSWVGIMTQRHMHEYGTTSEQLGWVSVAVRAHAVNNPRAMFWERPVTLADHQASPYVVEPLRLYDCCLDTDGAVAVVVTTAERARDLRRPPAYISAAAQGSVSGQEMMTSFYRDRISGIPEMGFVADELYRRAGIGPDDVDVVQFYDAFTPLIPMQLEEYRFCGRGEGGPFVEGAKRIGVGGKLPVNTSGGALSEAYIHGMNHIAEGVRQIRGTSVNQVDGAEVCLVTGGLGVPTSGLILRR